MTKKTKQVFAVFLSVAMIASSLFNGSFTAKAQEDDSQYFTFVSYAKDNADELESYNAIRATAGEYEAQIDGTDYTNYSLSTSAGGNATAMCGSADAKGIIDGNSGGGFQAKSNKDIQAMIVDMHRIRSISILQLSWEAASANTYAIDFSLDGQTWTTVAYIENCTKKGNRCDQIQLVTAQNTRYIRIQGFKRSLGYAYNLYEISAFSATGKADGANPIAAYTYTEEQQQAVDNAVREDESESESLAQWEEYQKSLSKYVDTDVNIAKGAKVYPSSYYNNEGKPDQLTDGNLSKQATTAKISKDNPTEYFIIDLGKEITVSDIDKIFINYVSNSGTWGKDGFKLYASNVLDMEMTQVSYNENTTLEVVGTDNTAWSVLYEENNLSNCENQNYYQTFHSDYAGSFRYIKLEYTYKNSERAWGIQINEFALYAPVEESTTSGDVGEVPTEPETLRPVTEPVTVDADSSVDSIRYQYKYENAGYAAGTISVSGNSDERYSLYWGTGNEVDGYSALTRNGVPYTALGAVESTSGEAVFKVISDYTAIPLGATSLLAYDEENNLQYAYAIPQERLLDDSTYSYTFASVGDQHYNRYNASGTDDALYAFDHALKFIDNQGIKFVAGTGDISALSEKSAYTKFKEAVGDYSNLTVLTCIGNHDCVNEGKQYFKQYINQDVYRYKDAGEAAQKENGILNIAENEMDFVYSPEGTDDVFVFLNQNEDRTNNYTQAEDILYDEQLDWLDEQLSHYTDRNVYLYFHTYLSTDAKSVTGCVGNLINSGNVFYDLTYNVNAADGERFRSIINKYPNLTMFNGHSHWLYSMQMFNPYLNIGTSSATSFNSAQATIVHVGSITSPRYVGVTDTSRTEMNNKASEGTFTDVYDDYKIYTGVDFWNGQYEAYATYIDPASYTPVPEINPIELTSSQLTVTASDYNEITVSWEETEEQKQIGQKYNIEINGSLLKENVEAGTYIFEQEAGLATVRVIPIIGEKSGIGTVKSVTVEAEPVRIPISEENVVLSEIVPVYSGKEITIPVSVSVEGVLLAENTDYTLSYENHVNAGIAKVTVTGIGQYKGTVTKEFTIAPKKLTDSDIIIDDTNLKDDLEFNGKDRTPIIKISYNGMNLNSMADFTIQYKNNFYPGTATVTIQGIENYSGTIERQFKIIKKPIGNVTIRTSFDQNNQLVIQVNNGSYAMTKGTDYDYTVVTDEQGNITITFTGLGNHYSGTFVKIIPAEENPNSPKAGTTGISDTTNTTNGTTTVKKVKLKSAKNVKVRKIKITWKKIKGVQGYKIRYAVNKKMKKAKVKTLKKNKKQYVLKKLKKNKTYYVQVCAYKISQGKTNYGKWSKKKRVKIKK